MVRKLFLFVLLFTCSFAAFSQADNSHMRISLVTCGPGDEEVWEVFGHTAIRIVDSANRTDLVYNYGTFSFGPNFEIQFMRGKLLYSLSVYSFQEFLQEYVEAKRGVQEQVLILNGKQKEQMYAFLQWNALPENKNYKYDFFFDNCATRIRDLFATVFGSDFHYANVLPPGKALSFRDIINKYFYRDHWTRLGINILLGSRIDKVMTNADIMFLPDYLRDGMAGAAVGGRKVATGTSLILPGQPLQPAGVNWALLLTCTLAALTIAGLSVRSLKILGRVMSSLLMLVSGLLGILILVMWFGTDHQGCGNNLNILWCLPTNIILAFANPKGKGRYALLAVTLIFVSLVLHLLRIQGLTLEMMPLLLALLCVYGSMYRQSKAKPIAVPEMSAAETPAWYYNKMGAGPAVILIHGFPASGTLWDGISDKLAASFTLIIPDLPGSGGTPLQQPVSIAEMAAGIKQIMDKEHIDKAVIAGHSMGGHIAFAFAALYPDRVAGLAAVHSTPAADDEEKIKSRKKIIELLRKNGKEIFIRGMVPNLFSAGFKQQHPEIVEEQTEQSLTMAAESMTNFYTAMLEREDRSEILEQAVFPVQWIIGDDDNALPYKKIIEKCYKSPVNFVSFYHNCGHMSMVEAPERLAADMERFIKYCYSRDPVRYE